jgi:mitochondrial chaperone BCS1
VYTYSYPRPGDYDVTSGGHSITLTTIGWSLQPLQDFVKTCHEYKIRNSGETTTVFFSGSSGADSFGYGAGGWRSVTKAIRKFDTIDIDEHIKNDLIHDAEDYYSNESKKCMFILAADYWERYRRSRPENLPMTAS